MPTETPPPPQTQRLEPRHRLRRAQFIAGLGFFSAVVGSILSGSVAVRLLPRLGGWSALPALLVETVVQRLWVLAALPIVCYGAARLVPLRPATAALGAALTGELFHALLDYVSLGWGGLYRDPGRFLLRLATLALGALLAMRAVRAARRASARAEAEAQRRAAGNRAGYAAFSAEAERLARDVPQPTPRPDPKNAPQPASPPARADGPTPVPAGAAASPDTRARRLPADTFVVDGSLRDIYVQDATLEDWRRVLDHVLRGPYQATLVRGEEPLRVPSELVSLFDEDGACLRFRCGRVELRCHFFDPSELELDLDPRTVSGDADEAALIQFMTTLAELTGKPVDLTPENAPEAPYVRCVQGRPPRVYSAKAM